MCDLKSSFQVYTIIEFEIGNSYIVNLATIWHKHNTIYTYVHYWFFKYLLKSPNEFVLKVGIGKLNETRSVKWEIQESGWIR